MPIGYVRMELINDDQKNVVDYRLVDANEAALEISGLKKEEIGMLASELDVISFSRLVKKLSSFDNLNEHAEIDITFPRTGKIGHNILYSPEPGVAVVLFSDITESVKAHEALERIRKDVTLTTSDMENQDAAEFFNELADWAYANGEAMLIDDEPEKQDDYEDR